MKRGVTDGRGKARILVVEDERLVAFAIEKSLSSMGYEVLAKVSTGEEALRVAEETHPDLVLMDIKLKGGMDGVEAASRIRAAADTPIVYLTAYSEPATLERAKGTEPFGYLVKPFEERTLQTTVEMALHKAARERRLKQTNERLETILAGLNDGIVVANLDGIVEYMNVAARRALSPRLDPDTRLEWVFRLSDGTAHGAIALPLDEVRQTGKTRTLAGVTLTTVERGRVRVDCDTAPLPDRAHAVRGFVISFRDAAESTMSREERLAQALEIRRSMMPPKEVGVPGLRHAWLFHPSRDSAGVLFSLFRIDDEHAGFYIVDVAGRGAASTMSCLLLRRFLTAGGREEGWLPLLEADPLMPREVAEKLVGRVAATARDPLFLQYGTLHMGSGAVSLVMMGRPNPILQESGGELRLLRPRETATPWVPSVVEGLVTLGQGDRLFLHSEGLAACENTEHLPYTEERLTTQARKTRALDIEAAVRSIEYDLIQWRGAGSDTDDVCLLVLERG